MSNNRHKKKHNHPKPQTLIDGSSYSPNSIGGRIDLQALRDKLFCEEVNKPNLQQIKNATDSQTSLQGKGKEK
jgi:hypothetical protein